MSEKSGGLRWPLAYDEKGELVTPGEATAAGVYCFEFGDGSLAPLVLRKGKAGRRSHFALKRGACSQLLEELCNVGISSWHLLWQCFAKKQCREVRIADRRADIRTPANVTIEIQRSPIDAQTVLARNKEHGTTVWVLDAQRATITYDAAVEDANGLRLYLTVGSFASKPALDACVSREKLDLPGWPMFEKMIASRPESIDSFFESFRAPQSDEKEATHEGPLRVARVYLDVGLALHVLRVWQNGGATLMVEMVSLETLLATEYGAAAEPRERIQKLFELRRQLLQTEKIERPTVDHMVGSCWKAGFQNLWTAVVAHAHSFQHAPQPTPHNSPRQISTAAGGLVGEIAEAPGSKPKRAKVAKSTGCRDCGWDFAPKAPSAADQKKETRVQLKDRVTGGIYCDQCRRACQSPTCPHLAAIRFTHCWYCHQLFSSLKS